jgi:hypothetical protein
MEVSCYLHVLAALPPEKDNQYQKDRRLARSQSQSGNSGGEEEIFSHPNEK